MTTGTLWHLMSHGLVDTHVGNADTAREVGPGCCNTSTVTADAKDNLVIDEHVEVFT